MKIRAGSEISYDLPAAYPDDPDADGLAASYFLAGTKINEWAWTKAIGALHVETDTRRDAPRTRGSSRPGISGGGAVLLPISDELARNCTVHGRGYLPASESAPVGVFAQRKTGLNQHNQRVRPAARSPG